MNIHNLHIKWDNHSFHKEIMLESIATKPYQSQTLNPCADIVLTLMRPPKTSSLSTLVFKCHEKATTSNLTFIYSLYEDYCIGTAAS